MENFSDGYYIGTCLGTVASVINTYELLKYELEYEGKKKFPLTQICLPEGWSNDQGVRVFIKWANEHPEKLHIPAIAGILFSHLEAYPCTK